MIFLLRSNFFRVTYCEVCHLLRLNLHSLLKVYMALLFYFDITDFIIVVICNKINYFCLFFARYRLIVKF